MPPKNILTSSISNFHDDAGDFGIFEAELIIRRYINKLVDLSGLSTIATLLSSQAELMHVSYITGRVDACYLHLIQS